MQLSSSVQETRSTVTVTGAVEAVDVPQLRERLIHEVDRDRGDVLLDMRGATAVDDLLMSALTVARSRAKWLRHRVVVLDDADGPTAVSLRVHGMQFRIPVYADADCATAGLAADRAARERLTVRAH